MKITPSRMVRGKARRILLLAALPLLSGSCGRVSEKALATQSHVLQSTHPGAATVKLGGTAFRAYLIAWEELILFGVTALIIFSLASVGIYYFESNAHQEVFASVFHSFWRAVATLATAGYGDIYPITVGRKIFTFIVLMSGLGLIAVPTGLFASALARARDEEDE